METLASEQYGDFNLWKRCSESRLLKLVCLVLIFSAISTTTLMAQTKTQTALDSASETKNPPAVAVSLSRQPLKEGTYLFGQSRTPGQLRKEYLVFKVRGNQVVGAFYMPSSSFDCFTGTVAGNGLDLAVVESYEQGVYTHTVNLNSYYPMQQVSETDQHILEECSTSKNYTASEP
ncbi:MAG: hypothetical protein HC934_01460 [Acaryochloridaceae cyanobacterium SU_2_1]|nr:hypothetical protein [Acaryochloridaceae cyanobacterium SU_2_1]NJM95337.1 hypothetical protein [Acaryochloridaceae cyanobacterium CSU_5_19]